MPGMTAHAEDEKGKLRHAHGLASSVSPEHPAGISHGMDMHKPTFQLADDEFSVCREDTDSNDNRLPWE